MAAELSADEYVRRIIRIHFDPSGGSPYWLERQRELGLDAIEQVRRLEDLKKLGAANEDDLRNRPLLDFVPASQRAALVGAVVTETGGATGRPKRTIFTGDEFRRAFVEPFVRVAETTGFPRGGVWLWLGPSGPHVIGQAAAACATALGGPQPFAIDLDPRWIRKLPKDSLARRRYLEHLLEQALNVIRCEPVDVIFTTPGLLRQLAEAMTDRQRKRIRGVHFGGMRVAPELLKTAQLEWFPNAVHLAGYGNSLFGLCMEFGGPPDRKLRYHPLGARHQVRVDEDGRVWMSRLDPTVMIANLRERDVAVPIPAPAAKWDGFGAGVEDPGPAADSDASQSLGIY